MMPKRIVDGEGVWRSDKLAEIKPAWIKAEYANLLPLAMANGSFELTNRRIWSDVYSYNRPEITEQKVEQIINELERVKLVFIWYDEATRKTWAYWVGINKPGRLPSVSRQAKKHERTGAVPPEAELKAFIDGQPMASHSSANGEEGLGLGSGLGSGIKPSSEELAPSDVTNTQRLECQLQRVWEYYIEQTGRNPKTYEFTASRQRKGRARLLECLRKADKDFDAATELMKKAVDGLASSDWHMGRDSKNLGKRFCEWEKHLFDSYEQMERWWNTPRTADGKSRRTAFMTPAEIQSQRETLQ